MFAYPLIAKNGYMFVVLVLLGHFIKVRVNKFRHIKKFVVY